MTGLMKGRTSFVIAHRLTTIKNAKRILVLTEDGIKESGSHEELLKKNGIYAGLYRMTFDKKETALDLLNTHPGRNITSVL
jgi:ATP-binding cassette subfamily B protein